MALVVTTVTNRDITDLGRLVRDELKVELDFLSALNAAAWGRSGGAAAVNEGNFWKLLGTLRKLGLAVLLWDDDGASLAQHRHAVAAHWQRLALRTDDTPAALLASCCGAAKPQPHSPPTAAAPLALQRRKHILHWLEQCFQNVLPADVTRPRKAKPDVGVGTSEKHLHVLQEQGFYSTDKDAELFKASLSLVLAGRLSDAQQLVRESGVAWRAAIWDRGAPHGYNNDDCDDDIDDDSDQHPQRSTGNPRRALWRRMVWRHSEQLCHDPAANADEAAIAALLSSNLMAALDCASLRSWEKGLFATLKCAMDRLEDELLHMHNHHRRWRNPHFPGTEFEQSEKEHLQVTSEMAGMDEADAMRLLASAPFEEMQGHDVVTTATASVLIGKSAIDAFLEHSSDQSPDMDGDDLRFATHMAFYLDALAVGTTAVVLDGVAEWKNELLLRYVRHLASREDLWYMLVLYASLLPKDTIWTSYQLCSSLLKVTRNAKSL
jgi:hypothetical protein